MFNQQNNLYSISKFWENLDFLQKKFYNIDYWIELVLPKIYFHTCTLPGSPWGRSPERPAPVQAHVLRTRTASQRRRRHLSRCPQHVVLQVQGDRMFVVFRAAISVTRFGYISPLWQSFKSRRPFLRVHLAVDKILYLHWQLFMLLG